MPALSEKRTLGDSALTISNLEAWYGPTQVLFGVSLSVERGEAVAIVGTNGAGKTTTIRSIIGLLRCTGRILIEGVDVSHLPAFKRARQFNIGVVHEGRGLFGSMSVLDNLVAGIPKREIPDVEPVLAQFPRLKGRLHSAASDLSGGEQQMVALGRIILRKPSLLLVDEPCLGLSPSLTEEVYGALKQLREQQTSIVLVEQNVRRAQEFSNRMCLIQIGRSGRMIDSSDDDAVREITETALGADAGAG